MLSLFPFSPITFLLDHLGAFPSTSFRNQLFCPSHSSHLLCQIFSNLFFGPSHSSHFPSTIVSHFFKTFYAFLTFKTMKIDTRRIVSNLNTMNCNEIDTKRSKTIEKLHCLLAANEKIFLTIMDLSIF